MLKSAQIFILTLVLSVFAVLASGPDASARLLGTPDPAANAVLAHIQGTGAKLYYMGNKSGLDGWLIVKDGQIQMAYTTSDHATALVGAMFGANGENITAEQIKTLVNSNKDVAALLTPANAPAPLPNPAAAVAPAPLAPTLPLAASVLPAPVSPGEKLIHDFATANHVTLGSNSSAPELFMVMDPNCPHCQATWRALRETVVANKLRLQFIPVGTPESDDERAAAILLQAGDPLTVWDKYVAGDKTQLAGTPGAVSVTAVRANDALVDSWSIHITPYLAYRGKDGKVKVLQGEPQKITALLGDLL